MKPSNPYDPSPLDPAMLRLLESARDLDVVPPDAVARLARSMDALGVAALEASASPLVAPSPPPAALVPPLGSPVNVPMAWVRVHLGVAVTTAALVGVATGVLLRGAFPNEHVVYVDRPAATLPPTEQRPALAPESPTSALAAAELEEPGPPLDSPSPRARSNTGNAASRPPSDARSLSAERALLDGARTALARGEANYALEVTARHQLRFPRGVLSEERDAMAIKALAMAGRRSDARKRADDFRAAHPASLFEKAIEAAVEN